MTKRQLLIFGINYAPEPTGIALNTTGLAEGLVRRGWGVTMVSGIPHYPSWTPGTAPRKESRNGVHIERYPHYVPPRQTALRRGLYEASWMASASRTLVRRRSVDVVLGVSPSLGGAALASLAGVRYGAPLCLLVQDLVGKAAVQSGMPGGSAVAGGVGLVERRIARSASAIVVVANGFTDYFTAAGIPAAKIHWIGNPARLRPATRDRTETRQRLGWSADDFVVLHTGSMGLKQDLDVVLVAADTLRGSQSVRFVLQGDGSQRGRLVVEARRRGLDNVQFLPLVPDDEYANVLTAADLLLLNQKATVSNMSMPAKLGTYFAAGRPVLAAVATADETAREIARSGGGVVIEPGNAAGLAEAITALRARPAEREVMGAAGRRFAQSHLRDESTVSAFETVLDGVTTSRKPDPSRI